jgi:hypothetical protein
MYSDCNFPTKKALRDAVAAGQSIRIYEPGPFPNAKAAPDYTGRATLEGPHYPKPHRWYAEVELINGIVTKVS